MATNRELQQRLRSKQNLVECLTGLLQAQCGFMSALDKFNKELTATNEALVRENVRLSVLAGEEAEEDLTRP